MPSWYYTYVSLCSCPKLAILYRRDQRMTNACQICCECKPRFHQPDRSHLIKATQAFERLNIDFKGPLASSNKNIYFLNVIDEYSRFPFVFPCPDMMASTVIKCLTLLFSVFGMPAFIHSDRGPSLVCQELQEFLTGKGVAMSHTTAYNPTGNGQVEKYNGTVWKAVTMACKSKNLPIKYWQEVLPDVLYSLRSLLCTAPLPFCQTINVWKLCPHLAGDSWTCVPQASCPRQQDGTPG